MIAIFSFLFVIDQIEKKTVNIIFYYILLKFQENSVNSGVIYK